MSSVQRFIFLSLIICDSALPFSHFPRPTTTPQVRGVVSLLAAHDHGSDSSRQSVERPLQQWDDWKKVAMGCAIGLGITLSAITPAPVFAYDGFAEYAKDNQMEKSDVGCFVNKCGDQTKDLFKNPRGIKGVSCLGRCKGEQSCAMQCFAEFGSPSLDDWLSCAIEENECVKMPAAIDNSAENIGYKYSVPNFDPKSLVGSWYKTDGLNPNYDLFPCQTNTFKATSDNGLDMGIFLRIQRPDESGGGFWENELSEQMVVDTGSTVSNGRNMHTSGKMRGLTFDENWYILGESDGSKGVPPFKLVAYKGHTLQGNYEGAFVYAKQPVLPVEVIPAVKEAALRGGLNFDDFQRIDNTCPVAGNLNDSDAGTGTSTSDWINLVVGEGGVIDWISPGWRGEYKNK